MLVFKYIIINFLDQIQLKRSFYFFSSQHEAHKGFENDIIKIEICEQFIDKEGIHERKMYMDNYDEMIAKTESSYLLENTRENQTDHLHLDIQKTRERKVCIDNYDEMKVKIESSYCLENQTDCLHLDIEKNNLNELDLVVNDEEIVNNDNNSIQPIIQVPNCKMCNYTFSDKDKWHVFNMQSNNKEYICSTCNHTSNTEQYLEML